MDADFMLAWDEYAARKGSGWTEKQRAEYERFAMSCRQRGEAFAVRAETYLQFDFHGKRVLDVGSAYGGFTIVAAARGATAVGIEILEHLHQMAYANAKGEPGDIRLFNLDILDRDVLDACGGQPFDLIVINDVFEHVYDSTRLFDRIRELSGPNTVVYFAIPNGESWTNIEREGHSFLPGMSLLPPDDYRDGIGGAFKVYYRPLQFYWRHFCEAGFPNLYLFASQADIKSAPDRIARKFDELESMVASGPFRSDRTNAVGRHNFRLLRQRLERDLEKGDPLPIHLHYGQYFWEGFASQIPRPGLDSSEDVIRLDPLQVFGKTMPVEARVNVEHRSAQGGDGNGRPAATVKATPATAAAGVPVLHVAWLPPDSQGGYRTRVVEETRLLVELGHPVDLAVFAPTWAADNELIAGPLRSEFQQQTGATVHVFSTSRFFDLTVSGPSEREIIQPLVRLVRERGVRIIHGQACYAARWALQVAERVAGLKMVFDCHGSSPEEELLTGNHETRAAAVEQSERELLCSADLAVLVSQQMGRHFETKYGLKIANQLLLPCCVDLAKFHHDAEVRRQARTALGLKEHQTVIGYAGTLAEWQWPEAMFRLFARIRERLSAAHLLLLVPERDHYRATSLLGAEGIPADAYTLREVPNAEIGRVLAAADAGLLLRQDHPVNFVSSPTKFGEYLAAGVPVIATSAVGDFSEWIRDERTGVVIRVSDDDIPAESLDEVCTFLSAVRTDRQGWAERCRALAIDRLDWKQRIRELSQAYASMVGRPVSGVASSGASGNGELGAATPGSVTRPVRLLFNGHDFKFACRFIEHFSRDPRYEVRIDEWPGHDARVPGQSEEMLAWADVIFCEWCLGNARWYSHHKRPGQKLFVRLHSQEMNLPYRFELAWDNVDAIVFISFQHHERFCREQPEQAAKSTVIFNYTDCDALDQPKLPGACFNLGLVGINPQLKRPDLALEILAGLRRIDSRYTLSIKSRMPWEYPWLWNRPAEREYYLQLFEKLNAGPLGNAVVFDPYGDDMPAWYSKIGFILSPSDREGSHQAVAEGMAAGCVPVIRNWEGATPLYPARFVFENVDQAVQLIRQFGAEDQFTRVADENRTYVRERFDTAVIVRQVESLVEGAGIRDSGANARGFPSQVSREAPAARTIQSGAAR